MLYLLYLFKMIAGKFIGRRGEMTQARHDHSIEVKPELLIQEILARILISEYLNFIVDQSTSA